MPSATTSLPETEPVIVIDSREQEPLVFARLKAVRGTLFTGDYSIAGCTELFAIERKSIPDLVACCMGENRERFEHELNRIRGFRFKRLLIVGNPLAIHQGVPWSRIKPQSVFGTLRAFEVRYDCPVVFRNTPEQAASQIERWALYFSAEISKAANSLSERMRGPERDRAIWRNPLENLS